MDIKMLAPRSGETVKLIAVFVHRKHLRSLSTNGAAI